MSARRLLWVTAAGLALAWQGLAAAQSSAAPTPAVERTVRQGPASVTLSLDRTNMTAAERLTLRLLVTSPAGAAMDWPPITVGEKLGGFTVVTRRDPPPALGDGGATTTGVEVVLEPFLPGQYQIPAFIFGFRSPGAERTTISTEPVAVTVRSLLGDTTEGLSPGPIRGIVDPPAPGGWGPWPIVGAVAGMAGLCTVATMAARRFRARSAPSDPIDTALQELAGLRRDLEGRTGAPASVFDLTAALLRRSLTAVCDERAAGMTTEEILAAAPGWPILRTQDTDDLRRILPLCDQARYAAAAATREQALDAVARATAVVERLRDGRAPESGGGRR
jgi:hypothetical protein